MNDMVRMDTHLAVSEDEMLVTLQNSLYPGASLESVKLVLAYCRASQLDPMTKPVHIVPMQVKVKGDRGKVSTVWRDVILPGIELYRTKAARTGCYAGMDSAKWGPVVKRTLGGEPKLKWDDQAGRKVDTGAKWETKELEFPEWCEVTVYRIVQGQRCAFSSGQVWFTETYATASNETSLPNAMWAKRMRGQLEKCAEALALRRAFPEIGAANTREEMEGRVINGDFDDSPPQSVQMPKPKSEQKQESTPTPKAESVDAEIIDDKPAADEPPVTANALRMLGKKLEASGKAEADLCQHFGIAELAELPMAKINAALEWAKS